MIKGICIEMFVVMMCLCSASWVNLYVYYWEYGWEESERMGIMVYDVVIGSNELDIYIVVYLGF